jgi:hypothetical protein
MTAWRPASAGPLPAMRQVLEHRRDAADGAARALPVPTSKKSSALPLWSLRTVRPWRATFLLVGLAGRRGADAAPQGSSPTSPRDRPGRRRPS